MRRSFGRPSAPRRFGRPAVAEREVDAPLVAQRLGERQLQPVLHRVDDAHRRLRFAHAAARLEAEGVEEGGADVERGRDVAGAAGEQALGEDLPGERGAGGPGLRFLRHIVEEAEMRGLRRRDRLAPGHEFEGVFEADEAGEALRRAGARDEALPYRRQAETGACQPHPEMAAEREFEAAAEHLAVQGGDDGLRRVLEGVDHLRQSWLGIRRIRRPGREPLPRAEEDERRGPIVGEPFAECVEEAGADLFDKRTVDADEAEVLLARVIDVSHSRPPVLARAGPPQKTGRPRQARSAGRPLGLRAASGGAMDLGLSERARPLVEAVRRMVRDEVIPAEAEYAAEIGRAGDRFALTPRQIDILEGLRARARGKGLWNFWRTGEGGAGLSTVEYAYLAEEMGWSRLAAEVFNCSAPDTGNMEVFEKYGTPEQKARWLDPLLEGRIRSAYMMTEPEVASSDATNISLRAVRDGDAWVLDGEKYWASGAGDPRCAVYIVMCLTDTQADRHRRHSQILVPAGTPGVTLLRPMEIFGHDDAPHGHMHVRFEGVRVPYENLVLGEGRGFEVAQGRLGPGRIHHCMRAIGQAERALALLCARAVSRTAFGKPLSELGANHDIIAESRIAIEQARLLCLKAAWMMDHASPREAAVWISQVKVAAPRMALAVCDEAIQLHGGTGISQDTPLAEMWMNLRTLRLVDGPDAVHRRQVARAELRAYTNRRD